MTGSRSLGLRYFSLSFASAFFMLSLLFMLLTVTVHPKPPQSLQAADTVPEAPEYLPERSEALTVLFLGTADSDSVAGTYILARFDPAQGSVPVVAFPARTVLEAGGRTQTLEEAYRYGGARYTRDALSEYLGIQIDRHVRAELERFVAAAAVIGGVEYELPADVRIGDGDLNLTLNRGMQLLDGRKTAGLISRPERYPDEPSRCELAVSLTCAIINQRSDIFESELIDKIFEQVVNLLDTDISYTDYERRKAAGRYLAGLDRDIAIPVPLAGAFEEDGDYFRLLDTCTAQILRYFA